MTLDVKTGQVLAMANAPTFDSSKPQVAKQDATAATGRSPTRTSRAACRRS